MVEERMENRKPPEEKAWNLMLRKCFHGTCIVIIISWCIYSRIYDGCMTAGTLTSQSLFHL